MDLFVTANGLQLRYRDEAGQRQQAVPLLLLHGVGGRLDVWDGVVAELSADRRCIRCDLRGHGESAKPQGPYSLDDFVADVAAFAAALGIDRFHLAGFSLGGLIAQSFALAHPDKLASLSLLSTVAGRTPEERERVMQRLALVVKGIPGAHFKESILRWFTEDFVAKNPALIEAYAARNAQNDPAAYAAAYRVLAESDLADRLSQLAMPSLVLTGEQDQGSNPRMARLMHDRIAGSELHILPGLRHSILIEAPKLVAGILRDFLSKHP